MMRLLLTAYSACAVLTVSGCNPYACIYRTRFIATQPQESISGVGSFAGYVNFRDYEGDAKVPPSIVWDVALTGATGTPTRIVLADQRDTTIVLAELPIQQTQGRISASAVDVGTQRDRDRAFEVLSSGNGVLILTLTDRSTPVLISLRVTDRENWHRPNCS
jgi:hypothetical protein